MNTNMLQMITSFKNHPRFKDYIKKVHVDNSDKYFYSLSRLNIPKKRIELEDSVAFESFYSHVYNEFNQVIRTLTKDEIQKTVQSYLDVFFISRLLSVGENKSIQAFQNSTHISNKVSSIWFEKHKSFISCPLEQYSDNHWPETIPFTFTYDICFNETSVFLAYSSKFSLESNNKISKGDVFDFYINFFKLDEKYYLDIKVLSKNNGGFKTDVIVSFDSLDELNSFVSYELSKMVFESYYLEAIHNLLGDRITFEEFNFEEYNLLFDMVNI